MPDKIQHKKKQEKSGNKCLVLFLIDNALGVVTGLCAVAYLLTSALGFMYAFMFFAVFWFFSLLYRGYSFLQKRVRVAFVTWQQSRALLDELKSCVPESSQDQESK